MTLDEFREAFEGFRAGAVADARAQREPTQACVELKALYQKFDEEERAFALTVLGEWVESTDGDQRWDARYLIREFRIAGAMPSLERSLTLLRGIQGAPARDEVLSVQKLLKELRTD